jgi:hypothetical protein
MPHHDRSHRLRIDRGQHSNDITLEKPLQVDPLRNR